MSYDSWITKEPEVYEEPPPAVDPKDEAYTEACEEIDKLKALVIRAADALEDKAFNWLSQKDWELIALLRKETK
jgi:hypothetical protein